MTWFDFALLFSKKLKIDGLTVEMEISKRHCKLSEVFSLSLSLWLPPFQEQGQNGLPCLHKGPFESPGEVSRSSAFTRLGTVRRLGPFKIFRAKASIQSLIHRLESSLLQTLGSWGRARKTTRKDQDEERVGDSLLEYLDIQIQAPSPFLALVHPRFSLARPLLFARPCHDQFRFSRFSHFRSRDKSGMILCMILYAL